MNEQEKMLRVLMLAATKMGCPEWVDPKAVGHEPWRFVRRWVETRRQGCGIEPDLRGPPEHVAELAADCDAWLALFDGVMRTLKPGELTKQEVRDKLAKTEVAIFRAALRVPRRDLLDACRAPSDVLDALTEPEMRRILELVERLDSHVATPR